MTKIEEIFKKHGVDIQVSYPPSPKIIEEMMKEYAEYYANICLQIAVDEAKLISVPKFREAGFEHYYNIGLDRDSILNIKLPEHE